MHLFTLVEWLGAYIQPHHFRVLRQKPRWGPLEPAQTHLMASKVFIDLPELISCQEWLRATASLEHPHETLRALERALRSYETATQQYRVVRDKLQDVPGKYLIQSGPDEQKLFDAVLRSFDTAAAAWDGLEAPLQEWFRNNDGRGASPVREAVNRLKETLDTRAPLVARARHLIKEATEEIAVPNVFHIGWFGSEPTEEVVRKAIILARLHPGAAVNLWVDQENLLAADWKRHTEALRSNGPFNMANDPAIESRLSHWQADENLAKGLDARLLSNPAFAERRNTQLAELERLQKRLQKRLPGDSFPRIRIRHVSELWEPSRPFLAHEEALTWQDRVNVRQAYCFEVSIRLCFAAAADRVVDLIVHDEPGQWLDIDSGPVIKGFRTLVDAYNTALDKELRVRIAASHLRARKRAARVPPDPEAMQVDYDTLRQTDLPRPIRPSLGRRLPQLEGYRLLLDAAREHLDAYVPKTDETLAENRDIRRRALAAHLRSFDRHGRVLQALQNWAANINSLEQGYERIPPLRVARHAFKMAELYPGEGAHDNSVLATSTAGARAVTFMARDKTHSFGRLCQKEQSLRAYLDDSAANRKNFVNTGPGRVLESEMLLKALRDTCGIVGQGSPLITIPARHLDNLETSETNTSKACAAAPQTSAEGPARRGTFRVTRV